MQICIKRTFQNNSFEFWLIDITLNRDLGTIPGAGVPTARKRLNVALYGTFKIINETEQRLKEVW